MNLMLNCDIVSVEVCSHVDELYRNASLSKTVKSSFISLIFKGGNMTSLLYYQPISLIGSLHKIIFEILAARMKVVAEGIISSC